MDNRLHVSPWRPQLHDLRTDVLTSPQYDSDLTVGEIRALIGKPTPISAWDCRLFCAPSGANLLVLGVVQYLYGG